MIGIYPRYNEMENTIDISNMENQMILRFHCGEWEQGLVTTLYSQGRLDALAIDNPLEYIRLAVDGEMQTWVLAQDELHL